MQKRGKRGKRINVANGCSYSELNVTPHDWQTGGRELLKRDWFITYRFYDPSLPNHPRNGKPIMWKAGINRDKTLTDRRNAVRGALELLKEALEQKAYNPLKKNTERKHGWRGGF